MITLPLQYLYWLKDAGGWGVHTSIGSEQVMMYFRDPYGDAAHELHHRQGWKKVRDIFV